MSKAEREEVILSQFKSPLGALNRKPPQKYICTFGGFELKFLRFFYFNL